MCFALYSDECFSAGDERFENTHSNFRPTQLHMYTTHVAPSDFQAEFLSKLLHTGTHLQKQAVATLSYTPAKYVCYTHKLYMQ